MLRLFCILFLGSQNFVEKKFGLVIGGDVHALVDLDFARKNVAKVILGED